MIYYFPLIIIIDFAENIWNPGIAMKLSGNSI